MPTPIRPKLANGERRDVYWIRKKVPLRYRPLVGKTEIWKSLGTTDKRTAITRCATASAELEAEWAKLAAAAKTVSSNPASEFELPAISHRNLHALRGIAHVTARDAFIDEPNVHARLRLAAVAATDGDADDEQALDDRVRDFLIKEGVSAAPADVGRFRPLFVRARLDAAADLRRAAQGDYSDNPVLAKLPALQKTELDLIKWFEFYLANGDIKGGVNGATAKRWRPKIKAFCDFVGHRDLARMTADDGYAWIDKLIARKYAKKSIRDVWIASIRATAGFAVERRKLKTNPFSGVKIRGDDKADPSSKKGFTDDQATTILTHTLDTPSHLMSAETRAARRWVPWLCAYSGARVNEITSLLTTDVRADAETGIWCLYLRREITKAKYERVVPLHSHLLEQKFLNYVEQRRRLSLPLFYDPARVKRAESASPIWHKVSERIGEWVRDTLLITGVKPSHGWRHRFKSIARDVEMHPEVEAFLIGHGGSDDDEKVRKIALKYGDPWVRTLSKNIEKYPRYNIAALNKPPAPHKRTRRTKAQIAIDEAAKQARKAARATRAA